MYTVIYREPIVSSRLATLLSVTAGRELRGRTVANKSGVSLGIGAVIYDGNAHELRPFAAALTAN